MSQEFSITKNIHPNFTLYGVGFYIQLTNAIIKTPIELNMAPEGEEPLWASMIEYDDDNYGEEDDVVPQLLIRKPMKISKK